MNVTTPPNAAATRLTRQSLSRNQQRFVSILQHIRWGRVPHVAIHRGEPDLREGLRWTRTIKVLGDNVPHPHSRSDDYVLRREFAAFFGLLAAIGEGEILNVDVRNGLPCDFELDESLPA